MATGLNNTIFGKILKRSITSLSRISLYGSSPLLAPVCVVNSLCCIALNCVSSFTMANSMCVICFVFFLVNFSFIAAQLAIVTYRTAAAQASPSVTVAHRGRRHNNPIKFDRRYVG